MKRRLNMVLVFLLIFMLSSCVLPTTNNNNDSHNPVLTLSGGTSNIEVGEDYVAPTCVANDEEDGELTCALSGEVDINTPKEYILTYTVIDSDGNSDVETFIVTVNEKSIPESNTPIITLNSGSSSIEVGEEYVAPICTANDVEDGVLTCTLTGEVDINIPGEYILTYTVTDSDGNIDEKTIVVTVIDSSIPDTNPPTITLTGGSESITVGDQFIEPTCKAIDEEDGELTCTKTGSINTNIAGTYTLTYDAIDFSGNQATTVTFTVVVEEDNSVPLSLTVHFLNNDISNFSLPYLYYWYDVGQGNISNSWPGTSMTIKVDSNWYTITIDGTDASNVIFTTAGSLLQTVDLYRSSEGWFVPTGIDNETGKLIGTWYDTEPVIDSVSIETKRLQVLAYITNLSYGNATEYVGTVSGQNCYHGDQITDTTWENGFETMIEDLYNETNEWVGMIGIDYEYDQIFTPDQLSETNQYLIDYANAGSLVTINWSPQNPWVNDELDILNNPGSPSGDASPQSENSHNAVTSLYDLIDEDKAVYDVWMRKLDRIADALQELEDAGVVVFWRPMQEMNGNWMWWGMRSHPDDPNAYIEVYQHMHDYFTNVIGLENLIWVYSPNSSFGNIDAINNTSSWNRSVSWAYPGDEYVDVVAGTEYGNDVIIHDYDEYALLGKPMGMAEIGPGSVEGDFQMDNITIIEQFSNQYPRIAYWVSWHWNWALINQDNGTELMTDSRVINQGDFDTSNETGDIIDNPEPIQPNLTVHFLNNEISNFSEPHLYYWYDLGQGNISNNWPGTLMIREGDSNWYYFTLEDVTASNVIFTTIDSSGQSIDLSRSSEGWFIPTGIDNETGKIIGTWYDVEPDSN